MAQLYLWTSTDPSGTVAGSTFKAGGLKGYRHPGEKPTRQLGYRHEHLCQKNARSRCDKLIRPAATCMRSPTISNSSNASSRGGAEGDALDPGAGREDRVDLAEAAHGLDDRD
jgi:hypothetical protein